jgi:DNA-binding MarR family transcriptional regulator
MIKRGSKAQILTDVMLAVFRVNGRLLDKGDELVGPLGINSARWQLLGPVAMAGRPLTTPQIAEAMGITRQGAQKQLNKMVQEGYFEAQANPQHLRSPLYVLTKKGRHTIEQAMKLHTVWSTRLAESHTRDDLGQALRLLERLYSALESAVPAPGDKP